MRQDKPFTTRIATVVDAMSGRARLLPSRDQTLGRAILLTGTMATPHASGFARAAVSWFIRLKV